ncbi:MAG: MarR family transcriptional regulator [Sphingomonas sp.]|nr:MAG: MarR family transcriptional regulator [Sphingomonas sp.]
MQDRPGGTFDVVLVAEPARVGEAGEVIARAGGRLLATFGWRDAGELTTRPLGRPVLALEAEGVAPALLTSALVHVREMVRMLDLPVVAAVDLTQLDEVYATFPGSDVRFLCQATAADRIVALASAGASVGEMMLADRWREGEPERLKKLNEEVARIAELLARLANRERDDDGGDEVGDRHLAFGYEPPADNADPRLIRQTIRLRRMRDAFLGDGLFEDPAWDMILDLYAAHLEGGRVSVSSLCIAAAVAPTTALRWIGKLTEVGLFERHPDPTDRRRAFLALSPRALKGMGSYFAAVRRAGVAMG